MTEIPALIVGVPTERLPGERRVALVPSAAPLLEKLGIKMLVQSGAGTEAGFTDDAYRQRGAEIVSDAQTLFEQANIIAQVNAAGAATEGERLIESPYRAEQVVIAQCDPLTDPQAISALAAKGVTAFALELMPRITRAQSMDVLSSMATIAGYRAVLIAATTLPRLFPMLMTAAGTLKAAKVLVMGAGVAGLQAIATARRLGAVVSAYDIRAAAAEQVESLGARFVTLDLKTEDAEGKGGYAKEMGEEFLKRQRELMGEVIGGSDVVITTAAIPGRKAPILVTDEQVERMAPGSVIVDIAAERGGNCTLTKAGETVLHNGVSIIGPTNLPATIPYHASEMYSKNVTTFLKHLVTNGQITIRSDDEIDTETLLCRGGEVVHTRLRELLELPPLTPPEPEPETPAEPETIPLYDGDESEEIIHPKSEMTPPSTTVHRLDENPGTKAEPSSSSEPGNDDSE